MVNMYEISQWMKTTTCIINLKELKPLMELLETDIFVSWSYCLRVLNIENMAWRLLKWSLFQGSLNFKVVSK